jgi:hypothetical protein
LRTTACYRHCERSDTVAARQIVIPAKAGIQYAVAYRFHHWHLWNTGSSASADDDDGIRLCILATHDVRGLLEVPRPLPKPPISLSSSGPRLLTRRPLKPGKRGPKPSEPERRAIFETQSSTVTVIRNSIVKWHTDRCRSVWFCQADGRPRWNWLERATRSRKRLRHEARNSVTGRPFSF